MNSTIDFATPQLSTVSNWKRDTEEYQPRPVSTNGSPREMVALFPAGRFFRFPVRVRIQLAGALCAEKASRHFDESIRPATERVGVQIGQVAWALIENATCIEKFESVPEIFLFGDVVIDFLKMELRRRGRLIDVTALEFKTLRYFVTHPEAVISRDELLNHVWGFQSYPTTRTVDNRIMLLRKKLEDDPANPAHFLTVHGLGYKFVP